MFNNLTEVVWSCFRNFFFTMCSVLSISNPDLHMSRGWNSNIIIYVTQYCEYWASQGDAPPVYFIFSTLSAFFSNLASFLLFPPQIVSLLDCFLLCRFIFQLFATTLTKSFYAPEIIKIGVVCALDFQAQCACEHVGFQCSPCSLAWITGNLVVGVCV